MKVLFATSQFGDYESACLWDGLIEVCGSTNVHDAIGSPTLHATGLYTRAETSCGNVGGPAGRIGVTWDGGERGYDLLILNACFENTKDWNWAINLKNHLRPGGKVAFVEGADGANTFTDPLVASNPPFVVDAVFRRELDPGFPYPYRCHDLPFSAPSRWFKYGLKTCAERDVDVFWLGDKSSHPCRWAMTQEVFKTRLQHQSIVGTGRLDTEGYFEVLRRSKIALCPAGAAGCDAMRTWEAVASGCLPIFINYSPWQREHWFEAPHTTVDFLAETIDGLLADPATLEERRLACYQNALKNHTTKARAEKLLRLVGLT